MLDILENGLRMTFNAEPGRELLLLCLSSAGLPEVPEAERPVYRAVEVQVTGEMHGGHHGLEHIFSSAGAPLLYRSHRDIRADEGRRLEFLLSNDRLEVTLCYQLYDGTSAVRCFAEVKNISDGEVGLEYVSSFALTGLGRGGTLPPDEKLEIHIPFTSWCGENMWKTFPIKELGMGFSGSASSRRINICNTGTWSAKEKTPSGVLVDTETGEGMMWQIESSCSWQWEIVESRGRALALRLSGPNESGNGWWKSLRPGESFRTVTAGVAVSARGFEGALGELTKYRRAIRRRNAADAGLPVIFNDYLNLILANPTAEKLLPVIDKASETGAEYFVMDAGWYADGTWWNCVGEWKPCEKRFPNGMNEVFDRIRSHGMTPGIWIEPEVMGVNCPLAAGYEDECFFMRHGKRVLTNGRYQLDFRSKRVTDYLDGIIDGLVNDYGIGYFKFDYNIEPGVGTEVDADSFGDGLLKNARAYQAWLTRVLDRHPELIIESCSSGGMRADYSTLALHTIQSMTDQSDYRKIAPIAAAAASNVLPEQAAIWSVPAAGSLDRVAMNMINALPLRIHLSGGIPGLSDEEFALVREGVELYKSIRGYIPRLLPFYPLGMPELDSKYLCSGYACEEKTFIALWRLNGESDTLTVRVPEKYKSAKILYPSYSKNNLCTLSDGALTVGLPNQYSAVFAELE